MRFGQAFLLALFVVAFLLAWQSAFIVRETNQAMVTQFGDPVALHTEPGLKFKMPFVQNVAFFDERALNVDTVPEEVLLADRKRVVVDTFARYRIIDMLQFYRTMGTEVQANTRLNNMINSAMRAELGQATLAELLSEKRDELMGNIRDAVNGEAKRQGIEIVDVRIGRADLPEQTSQAIYARMRTEREREAAEFRAQGQELAQEIKSRADRERTVLIAEAQKESQILRGIGDEQAIGVYATAFKRDPEFYGFYRTMEAYRESLAGDSTTLILSPEGDFFKYFNSEKGVSR